MTRWLSIQTRRLPHEPARTAAARGVTAAAAPKSGQDQPKTAGSCIACRAMTGRNVPGMMYAEAEGAIAGDESPEVSAFPRDRAGGDTACFGLADLRVRGAERPRSTAVADERDHAEAEPRAGPSPRAHA